MQIILKELKGIVHGYFLPVCVKHPELKGRRYLFVKVRWIKSDVDSNKRF